MTSTLDRLRRLHGLKQKRTSPEPELAARAAADSDRVQETSIVYATVEDEVDFYRQPSPNTDVPHVALEEIVVGEVIENSGGACYQVTQVYPLHEPRGLRPLGHLLAHAPQTFASFHPQFQLERNKDFYSAAFIDTETTGLGGGAGVYAFMVGVGTFERHENRDASRKSQVSSSPIHNLQSTIHNPDAPTHFVVRQFFMRNPAEEPALLVALADLLEEHEMTVTFNGRTFDLPLLRTRYQQNRVLLLPAYQELALLHPQRGHLDLLHPARRIWRRRLQSCRLINLEQQILGLYRSGDDVPSHLIPSLYVDYVRTGNACALGGIFYHNSEDIVSMVALAERLCAALGGDGAELHAVDWVSLGCAHEARKAWGEAEMAFRRALDESTDDAERAEAFKRLGLLLKRQARWQEAIDIWQLWLSSVSNIDSTPYVELAKYCEWQIRDLEQAEMWTGWALHNLKSAPGWQQSPTQICELEHRLARLRRKQQ